MGMVTYTNSIVPVTFGHNRLSIIDLDARSNQPFNYQGQVHLVFNGEIYNFQELRTMLVKKGYSFTTNSDTEVICAAYLAYGEACVNQFNGMFSFVLYDVKEQILFGAKDRLGQKPFYYQLSPKGFEFASQISSIQLFNDQLSISRAAIQHYLTWNAVPSPYSIFSEVRKLEDGHSFKYDLKSMAFTTRSYWNIDSTMVTKYTGSFGEAKIALEAVLTEAIGYRMIADVPLGVFLSGGVDSSLIAALAAKHSKKRVKTFAVKFNEKGFDESSHAQKVADHLNTEHHVIQCDYKEGIDLITNFSYYYDEPFADASAIPTMLLAKHTKPHVTVALSGDGADEAFLGYREYASLEKINRLMKIPYSIRKFAIQLFASSNNNRYHAMKGIIKASNAGEAFLQLMTTTDAPWLKEPYDIKNASALKYLLHSDKNIFERAGDFDLKTYLSWDINTKIDRATMAYSLEARSPFLDYKVVEFAQALPTTFKYQKGNQKRILKDILYDHVPRAYVDRPKSGFGMPLEIWFRNDLKELVLSELSLENLKEIPCVKPKIVHTMIQEHINGKWNHYAMIWKLLVLRQWLRQNGKGYSIS